MTTCCVFVKFWPTSFSCKLISSSLSAQSLNTSRYSSSPQHSAFNLSISAWASPRATRTALSSCHRTLNVGLSTPVVDTWPYNSLRKNFMRVRFASREVSLEGGLVCQPDRGGDSPQILVRSRNRRVMSKEMESGLAPLGGNNLSHWGLLRIRRRKRRRRALYCTLRSAARFAGG